MRSEETNSSLTETTHGYYPQEELQFRPILESSTARVLVQYSCQTGESAIP